MNMPQNLDPISFWPVEKPNVPPRKHGWFTLETELLFRKILNKETRVIVELGAWMGASTRFLLDHAPNALVFSVDTWKGGPEHQDPNSKEYEMLPTLYETFLVNMWEYRNRLIPLRMSTQSGLTTIYQYGYKPDMIYIDAEHTYDAVCNDISLSHALFPEARLVGDDFDWGEDKPVGRAAKDMADQLGFSIYVQGGWAWLYFKKN